MNLGTVNSSTLSFPGYLAYFRYFAFLYDFENQFTNFYKILLEFDLDCIETIGKCGENFHLDNIESFSLWTWYISPFTWVLFNFSQQCIINFSIKFLHIFCHIFFINFSHFDANVNDLIFKFSFWLFMVNVYKCNWFLFYNLQHC